MRKSLAAAPDIFRQAAALAPVWAVGGCVRDLLLQRPLEDIDLVVEGNAARFAGALAEAVGGTARSVPHFGTARVTLPDGSLVDVAGARRETYPRPGALPEVLPSTLADDLSRRDFSINAIALCLKPDGGHALVDPLGGVADLEAGLIRILHPRSFLDDPTRLLRAARHAARLGFVLEAATEERAREAVASGALATVSPQRIRQELVRTWSDRTVPEALALLAAIGALGRIFPGLEWSESLRGLLRQAVALAAGETSPPWPDALVAWRLVAAANLSPLPPGAAQHLHFARADAAVFFDWRPRLQALEAAGTPPAQVYDLLRDLPAEGVALLWLLSAPPARRRIWLFLDRLRHVRLAISGKDLLRLGFAPGPHFAAALRAVREARLNGQVEGREAQLNLAAALLSRSSQAGRSE